MAAPIPFIPSLMSSHLSETHSSVASSDGRCPPYPPVDPVRRGRSFRTGRPQGPSPPFLSGPVSTRLGAQKVLSQCHEFLNRMQRGVRAISLAVTGVTKAAFEHEETVLLTEDGSGTKTPTNADEGFEAAQRTPEPVIYIPSKKTSAASLNFSVGGATPPSPPPVAMAPAAPPIKTRRTPPALHVKRKAAAIRARQQKEAQLLAAAAASSSASSSAKPSYGAVPAANLVVHPEEEASTCLCARVSVLQMSSAVGDSSGGGTSRHGGPTSSKTSLGRSESYVYHPSSSSGFPRSYVYHYGGGSYQPHYYRHLANHSSSSGTSGGSGTYGYKYQNFSPLSSASRIPTTYGSRQMGGSYQDRRLDNVSRLNQYHDHDRRDSSPGSDHSSLSSPSLYHSTSASHLNPRSSYAQSTMASQSTTPYQHRLYPSSYQYQVSYPLAKTYSCVVTSPSVPLATGESDDDDLDEVNDETLRKRVEARVEKRANQAGFKSLHGGISSSASQSSPYQGRAANKAAASGAYFHPTANVKSYKSSLLGRSASFRLNRDNVYENGQDQRTSYLSGFKVEDRFGGGSSSKSSFGPLQFRRRVEEEDRETSPIDGPVGSSGGTPRGSLKAFRESLARIKTSIKDTIAQTKPSLQHASKYLCRSQDDDSGPQRSSIQTKRTMSFRNATNNATSQLCTDTTTGASSLKNELLVIQNPAVPNDRDSLPLVSSKPRYLPRQAASIAVAPSSPASPPSSIRSPISPAEETGAAVTGKSPEVSATASLINTSRSSEQWKSPPVQERVKEAPQEEAPPPIDLSVASPPSDSIEPPMLEPSLPTSKPSAAAVDYLSLKPRYSCGGIAVTAGGTTVSGKVLKVGSRYRPGKLVHSKSSHALLLGSVPVVMPLARTAAMTSSEVEADGDGDDPVGERPDVTTTSQGLHEDEVYTDESRAKNRQEIQSLIEKYTMWKENYALLKKKEELMEKYRRSTTSSETPIYRSRQSSRAPSVEDDKDGHLIYREGDILQDR
ncbi:unnamed protein product [Cyprideis torosa]|uniref:Uncharacterized protein n=1 Tax=Cyprideis torosa TaxID=163714 RepID=A0A7R8WIT0_9CRUS|nr:unnamed protein product [Cyprideis torosa]CAG0894837.1 unnamed protein product [Cyprideis torosa]